MNKIAFRRTLVASAAAVGLLAGGLVAAVADDGSEERPTLSAIPTPGIYEKDLPPFKILGNGATAGNWRPETPPEKRPDFVPVYTGSGEVGYVKRSDIFDGGYIPLDKATGTHTLTEAEERALRSEGQQLKSRANADGKLYADVYADDGVTVIDTMLVGEVQ